MAIPPLHPANTIFFTHDNTAELDKRIRQSSDTNDLTPAEKVKLGPVKGDDYIGSDGVRHTIISDQDLADARKAMLTKDGAFIIKKGDDTIYYHNEYGFDILRDGSNYTTSVKDDIDNITYSNNARAGFERDMLADGNTAQLAELNKELENFDVSHPKKNAITLNKAEEYLLERTIREGQPITKDWMLQKQKELLAKEKDGTLTQDDQDELNAISRLLLAKPLMDRIENTDAQKTEEYILANYKKRTGNDMFTYTPL